MARANAKPIIEDMKAHGRKRHLTFGEFAECMYDVCGKRKTGGVVRLALKTHLIEFRKHTL